MSRTHLRAYTRIPSAPHTRRPHAHELVRRQTQCTDRYSSPPRTARRSSGRADSHRNQKTRRNSRICSGSGASTMTGPGQAGATTLRRHRRHQRRRAWLGRARRRRTGGRTGRAGTRWMRATGTGLPARTGARERDTRRIPESEILRLDSSS
ncbi:hypothetical protein BD413DRAFT_518312, partial [Trametes elegans]